MKFGGGWAKCWEGKPSFEPKRVTRKFLGTKTGGEQVFSIFRANFCVLRAHLFENIIPNDPFFFFFFFLSSYAYSYRLF